MPRSPTLQVAAAELAALFEALEVWAKIRDGRFTTAPVLRARRPSTSITGGFSDILRHATAIGYHVATTHRITAADGSIVHWDAKDLRIGEVVIWRL